MVAPIAQHAWSQYLGVGIAAYAEIFTKSQPMSAVGTGADVGIHPKSAWNNPEPEVVLFASLVAAGMPFMLLVGAAPNAIAYGSKQFTSGEFFLYGCIPSVVLMVLLAICCYFIWPLMGMPVLVK